MRLRIIPITNCPVKEFMAQVCISPDARSVSNRDFPEAANEITSIQSSAGAQYGVNSGETRKSPRLWEAGRFNFYRNAAFQEIRHRRSTRFGTIPVRLTTKVARAGAVAVTTMNRVVCTAMTKDMLPPMEAEMMAMESMPPGLVAR